MLSLLSSKLTGLKGVNRRQRIAHAQRNVLVMTVAIAPWAAGCAANQTMHVISTPSSASCKLTQEAKELARIPSTPATVKFERDSDEPVVVECKQGDMEAVKVIDPNVIGFFPEAIQVILHASRSPAVGPAQAIASDATSGGAQASVVAAAGDVQRDDANAYTDASRVDLGRYHALVIGIDDYKHLTKLRTAVADAKLVGRVLETDYGYSVRTLLNPTRDQIIEALDTYIERLSPGDSLLIYYAGHGWRDEATSRGYWLPSDAAQERRSHWLSNAEIDDTLKALRAKHVMIVADSCYAATLTRSGQVGLRDSGYLARIAQKRARLVLTSGGVEPVADDVGDGHSPFATSFVQALEDNTNLMDGTQLFVKLRRLVMLKAKQTPEYADIRNAGHEGGDFLFKRKSAPGVR